MVGLVAVDTKTCTKRPQPEGVRAVDKNKSDAQNPYFNVSKKPLIRVLKSRSRLQRASIFRIEWITVVWCLPPKLLPIWGREAFVSVLHKYIAICRGRAIAFELFRDLRSEILRSES